MKIYVCLKASRIKMTTFLLFMFLAAGGLDVANGAKILGVFPVPGRSSAIVHSALMKELAKKGHEVTVISRDFTNSSFVTPATLRHTVVPMGSFEFRVMEMNYLLRVTALWEATNYLCDILLQTESIKNLIRSKKHFDLVISEGFCGACILGLAHKYNAPIVQIVTYYADTPCVGDWVGNPNPYSYVPDAFQDITDKMTFYQRILNTLQNRWLIMTRKIFFVPKQQELLEKYFSNYAPLPSIHELDSWTSLILLNHHFSMSYPRPLMPNMVQVGGMHIKPPQKLPDDIETFLNGAPFGVIYFSLGVNIRSADLPKDKINSFLEAFSKLKQRVIWKFEGDTLPGKPQNVKIGEWLPQFAILGHPYVRVFVTHGGLLGIQETIYWGVPIVGIPFMADQRINIMRAVESGYAINLDYENISAESICWALKEVLKNPSYFENAQRLSQMYRDRPESPLKRAVYWTEYVIRHKGARQMRSHFFDLPWYEYFWLDVIALSILAFVSLFLVIYLITRVSLNLLF